MVGCCNTNLELLAILRLAKFWVIWIQSVEPEVPDLLEDIKMDRWFKKQICGLDR